MKDFAEAPRPIPGSQNMPWDPILDYQHMWGNTEAFMSIWKSLKPVVCKIRGGAVAGGSDIALLCDVVIMEENARIGYPPARLWGCPTTAMWVYRVGITWAKRLLLTGDLIDGRTAERIGLAYRAVPADQLDAETDKIVQRMSTVPINQLAMQKMVINQAVEAMGLVRHSKPTGNMRIRNSVYLIRQIRISLYAVWNSEAGDVDGWGVATQPRGRGLEGSR